MGWHVILTSVTFGGQYREKCLILPEFNPIDGDRWVYGQVNFILILNRLKREIIYMILLWRRRESALGNQLVII